MFMDLYELFKNFISGGVAGVFCLVTGHPFDTVKVRLQTMPRPLPGESPIFANTIDCFRKTVTREGFLALFKVSLQAVLEDKVSKITK